MNAYYLRSANFDPFYNLAVEEYMLDHLPENSLLLYFWQGDNVVAIGRYQNPWKETDAGFMERNNITLARRMSGGGAVYLDRGTLNFSFIADQRLFDVERQLGTVRKSLLKLGIDSTIGKRKGLFSHGKKFSGGAFAYRHGRALHHGTLLISTDMGMMRALKTRLNIKRLQGTLSEYSEVINLSKLNSAISVESAANSLFRAYRNEFGSDFQYKEVLDQWDPGVISKICERHASWEWRYGATPPFDADFKRDGVGISIHVDRGRMGRVVLLPEGNTLTYDGEGPRFHAGEVKRALEGTDDSKVFLIGEYTF